jgi:hypothetical protein
MRRYHNPSARTIGDFSSEWRKQSGVPELARRPETFVMEPVPIAPTERPLRLNDTVACDQPTGVFRPCACGCTTFTVQEGKGPHAAQLTCDHCRRGGRWLSHTSVEGSP